VRILLVDDNAAFLANMAEGLRMHGVDVATASNSAQALDIADGCDAAVIDLKLANEDGEALGMLLRKRAEPRRLPLVLVSGVECPETSFDVAIEKPVLACELLAAIRGVLA
jgi:DNA-binding response OmpR family regulator